MATTSSTTGAALSLKLFVDTKAQRVVFAEADKDAADFLSSLRDITVATAVELLGKDALPGCIGNFCASVQKLEAFPRGPSTVTLPNVNGKGFVQETYSVSENLTVTPLPAFSGIATFYPRAPMPGHLQEKTVPLGHNEALGILKAWLLFSKTILTDVFLGEKAAPEDRA